MMRLSEIPPVVRSRSLAAASLALGCGAAPASAGRVSTAIVAGHGVFVENGALFEPRGVNFDREGLTYRRDGTPALYHVTFDPGSYDPLDARTQLRSIAASGYTVVRVFLSSVAVNRGYGLSSPGVGAAYVADLADFLETAARNGLGVILATDGLPANYDALLRTPTGTDEGAISDLNRPILSPAYADALARNLSDLLTALRAASPTALSAIMAVEAMNEGFVYPNCAPFAANRCVRDASGALVPDPGPAIASIEVGGATYDLARDADRQDLVDAATFTLIGTVRTAVRAIDPTILVGMGAFTMGAARGPGTGFNGVRALTASLGERYPVRSWMIGRYGPADFVDLHVYAKPSPWTLQAELASDGIGPATVFPKPVLMGEFGASVANFPTASAAAAAISGIETASCGYGFTGWNLWTWDTANQSPPAWTATASGGAINGVVAPVARPVVCAPIPARLFQVPPTVAYSNGTSYCVFATWQSFVALTRRTSLAGIPAIARLPDTMPFRGRC